MITEDYISFETAKILKEKGFDVNTLMVYSQNGNFMPDGAIEDTYQVFYAAPTLQTAMKWLREVHNVLIVVDYEWECDTTPYYFKIYRLGEHGKPKPVAVKVVSYDKDDNPKEHIVGYRDGKEVMATIQPTNKPVNQLLSIALKI